MPTIRASAGRSAPRVLRACLETTRGAVFAEKAGWRGATKENIPGGSSTKEQRSQTAFSPKTLRAAGLLSVAGVGSFLTARCGDARNSPPWPQPKSLAAAPLVVSKQALRFPLLDRGPPFSPRLPLLAPVEHPVRLNLPCFALILIRRD